MNTYTIERHNKTYELTIDNATQKIIDNYKNKGLGLMTEICARTVKFYIEIDKTDDQGYDFSLLQVASVKDAQASKILGKDNRPKY